MTHELTRRERVLGCFLGGAVGDALGNEIEFLSTAAIRQRFGPAGITGYPSTPATITDDTQMTLFTAEGLLRAHNRWLETGTVQTRSMLNGAYLRWYDTQQYSRPGNVPKGDVVRSTGWLITNRELYHRRAPGNTCLSALRSGGEGSAGNVINDSKGCGGVMRAAPCGLMPGNDGFQHGIDAAALTHTHPTGHLAAGALSYIVHLLFEGGDIATAVEAAIAKLQSEAQHEETASALRHALDVAASDAEPNPETVERLGGGWIAEEALAISVYCALTAESFASAVLAAVNHSGDSDSTGAITGNLLGVSLGIDAIPAHWLDELLERDLVETVAGDFYEHFHGNDADNRAGVSPDSDRYPGV